MKRTVFVLAALALAAGCVESDPSTVAVAPSESTVATAPEPGEPGASTTVAPGPSSPVAPGGPAPSPTSAPTPPDRPSPSVGGPGSAATHLLRPSGARQLVLQVLTHDGAEPRRETLDRLEAVLGEVSGKPVRVIGGDAPAARAVWTTSDLRSAADAAAVAVDDGTAVVRFLFVGGRSDAGDGVLGIAATGDVAAVFTDRVDDAATGLASPAAIERAVAVHELGHLLGLVDLVLDTGRADPEHPGHSSNRRSVMYWAVESSLVGDLLGGGPPQQFDEQDLADLAAIRRG